MLTEQFAKRLNYGCQVDIIPLCEIPQVKGARARALFNAGLRTVAAVATASLKQIESAIGANKAFLLRKKRSDESMARPSPASAVPAPLCDAPIPHLPLGRACARDGVFTFTFTLCNTRGHRVAGVSHYRPTWRHGSGCWTNAPRALSCRQHSSLCVRMPKSSRIQ